MEWNTDPCDEQQEETAYPVLREWIQPDSSQDQQRDPIQHIFPWSNSDQPERVLVTYHSGCALLWELGGSEDARLRAELTYDAPDPDTDCWSGIPLPVAAEYPLVARLCPDGIVRIWKLDGQHLDSEVVPIRCLTDHELVPAPLPPKRPEPLAHPLRKQRRQAEESSVDSPTPKPNLIVRGDAPSEGATLNTTKFNPLQVQQLTWLPTPATKVLSEQDLETQRAAVQSPTLLICLPRSRWLAKV